MKVGTFGKKALMTSPDALRVATGLVARLPDREIGIPAVGQLAGEGRLELGRFGRDRLSRRRRSERATAASASAPRSTASRKCVERFVRHVEGGLGRPAEVLLGGA